MNTHTHTAPAGLQHLRKAIARFLVAVFVLAIVPDRAFAVPQSAPALLANTESFQQIDTGDGTTSIELYFGTNSSTLSLLTTGTFRFNKSLSVQGGISGSYLIIDRQANISGSLTVKGNTAVRGNLSGSSLFGAGLGDCSNSTTSKLIYNPTTGKFSCATDQTGGGTSGGGGSWSNTGALQASFDRRYVNVSGDTMTGALTVHTVLPHSATGALNVVQQTNATGAYIKSTTSREPALAIDIVGTPNAPHLVFGYQGTFDSNLYRAAANLLKTNSSFFALGTVSGSRLRVDGNADIHGALSASGAVHFDSNLSINDDRTAADAVLTFGNATLNQDLKYLDTQQRFQFSTNLTVMGTISGASLAVSGASSFSGAALFRTTVTAKGGFSGSTLYGAGLGNCSNATTSKLLYNPATGKFTCGTDQTGGGTSGGGLAYADAEGIFVNQGGDTMTGTLNIEVTSSDVVKTTTGNTNATDFSKAGSTLFNVTSENDVITMDRGTVPSGGQGTFGASSVVTTANLGAGSHTILRDDGQFIIFLGNATTTVNRWDGISTSMSAATAATTAIGAGALSLRRPDGRYLVVPGGGSSTAFLYDPYNITANSSVTLTSCAGTTGTNAFLVSTGSYVITCGGSGNWGIYNATSNVYMAGTALGASFGAGSHAIQRDDGTFLVFAGGNSSNHWIFYPGMQQTRAWSAINPIADAPTITTGAFSIRRADGKYLVVGGAQDSSSIYDPAASATEKHGTFTSQSGAGYGPTAALADGAQALWRQDRKYVMFVGGSQTTNIIDVSRTDEHQFTAGPSIGATPGAGFHAFYNARGTVQLLLGGASTTTRYYDVGYIKGGPSTSTGAYYETECITTSLHSGSYLSWKMNGDDHKTKVYVQTGNGACDGGYKLIPRNGDLIRPTSGHNRVQMKVVFERLPARFADQEWGLRRGLSQTQYRRLMDVPGLQELVLRNTANLHRTQFEFGRGGSFGEPLAVNLLNNGDKNLQLQLANTATYPTTINATNTNYYNGAFTTAPNMPRTISIGTVVLKRPDGKFVIIPGSNSGSTAQQRSMLYDQDANAFYNNSASPTVPLSTGSLAFKRHDGTFFIVAGGNTNSTMIYDPTANTFTAGPTMIGRVGEGSQVMAMPNGRVTIIHGQFQRTTTIYDSYSNNTISGAMLTITAGRGTFVVPKPDGTYLVGPGTSTQACALRTTSMTFNPYANFFTNGSVTITTGTGPGAYAVERSDGTWLILKGGGTAGTCAGVTATLIYNPFSNKTLVGPTLSAATRYGSTAMQRPDGTWLITAGGGLTTSSIVNEKSGAFTADGISPVGTSNVGPALVTASGTGSLAFQRDDGKYVLLSGANAVGSAGVAVAQIYDPAWVLDGYYRSEPINIPDLDSNSTLSWQSPDSRGIAARVRTGTSALTLQTAEERELESSGDRVSPNTGDTWLQVNFSFRRYLPPNKGIYEDVWYNGGAMPQTHFRQIPNPTIQQFSVGKDKDIANFKVDGTSLFRVSGNGDIYTGTKGALFSGGADLAERYHSADQLRAGDLVTFDYEDDHAVRRSTVAYQPELIGVVSTSPGFVAGAFTKDSYPIALVGRVPVNVSLENGPIKTGDRLTSASIPGYAMKAVRAGRVVGVALESSKPEKFTPCAADPRKMCGQVMMFVDLSDWQGSGK